MIVLGVGNSDLIQLYYNYLYIIGVPRVQAVGGQRKATDTKSKQLAMPQPLMPKSVDQVSILVFFSILRPTRTLCLLIPIQVSPIQDTVHHRTLPTNYIFLISFVVNIFRLPLHVLW